MTTSGYALFDTALGTCALAWGPAGLVGLSLPESGPGAIRARIAKRHPDLTETPPPPQIQAAIEGVVALLTGEPRDLTEVAVDFSGVSEFEARVHKAIRDIPPGTLITYGELARRLGDADPRAVGVALGRNPVPVVVPCHRVVGAGGKLVGFSAPGGVATKRRLLEIERARMGGEPDLFDPPAV
jgi:methylated-DNA-[protein]-cysteine S-methyltransferase